MKKLLTLIAVFASFTMWAQTQVSGTVTDADGQPLPGANIVLDGTTGAVSDFDGNFSLSTINNPHSRSPFLVWALNRPRLKLLLQPGL